MTQSKIHNLKSKIPLLSSLIYPSFALLLSGQTLSRIGDHLYQVALAWWVLEKTGSATMMGTSYSPFQVQVIAFAQTRRVLETLRIYPMLPMRRPKFVKIVQPMLFLALSRRARCTMITPSVRTKLDQHLIAAQALLYRTIPGGLYEVMPHWARGFSGSQFPVFNIFLPRTPLGLTDEVLADTEAFYSSRNALYAIELIHDRLPEGPDFLNQRNYQALPPQPAMFLPGTSNGASLNSDAVIERVATVPALTAFCTLLQAVFEFPLADLVKIFPVAHLRESKIGHYVAFINEEPVGAGTVVCAEGVASVWNMCTRDSHRRQGIATTLLSHMLKEAGKRDCRSAMLYSTAQAYNFYNQFGFEIYTQRQWFLPPGIDYDEDEE